MIRNYLSGSTGDKINTLFAPAAYNMKKRMRIKKQKLLDLIFGWIYKRLFLHLVLFKPSGYKKNSINKDQLSNNFKENIVKFITYR